MRYAARDWRKRLLYGWVAGVVGLTGLAVAPERADALCSPGWVPGGSWIGGPGNDSWNGGIAPLNQRADGMGGNDILQGGGGGDALCGSGGNDILLGQDGDDLALVVPDGTYSAAGMGTIRSRATAGSAVLISSRTP